VAGIICETMHVMCNFVSSFVVIFASKSVSISHCNLNNNTTVIVLLPRCGLIHFLIIISLSQKVHEVVLLLYYTFRLLVGYMSSFQSDRPR